MKRYFFVSILNLLLCAWLPFLAHAGGQRSVTDLVGRSMTVPEQPRRVVALAPSITEIVYALQMEACLAGVTRFSDFPLPAQSLPKVGSYVKLDVERIAALKPDLCIAISDGNPVASVEQLQTLRIPVFAVNPHDLQSVMQSILAIADLLGAERKARII
ncbi:MAG: helical backbone metal receptor, partial [Desulfosarcinaceae bacterium]